MNRDNSEGPTATVLPILSCSVRSPSSVIRPAMSAAFLSLVVAIASITAVGLGISLAIPLLSLTLEARGVVPGWIGANAAAWGLASMATTPFVPRFAARYGMRPVLAGSILVSAAILPFFYF